MHFWLKIFFNLQWIHWNMTPLEAKEHLYCYGGVSNGHIREEWRQLGQADSREVKRTNSDFSGAWTQERAPRILIFIQIQTEGSFFLTFQKYWNTKWNFSNHMPLKTLKCYQTRKQLLHTWCHLKAWVKNLKLFRYLSLLLTLYIYYLSWFLAYLWVTQTKQH